MVRKLARIAMVALLAVLAGCGNPMAPEKQRPVAVAEIEIITMPSSTPIRLRELPNGGISCSRPAHRMTPRASSDLRRSDVVEGAPTYDLLPRTNPFSTSQSDAGTGLYTIGIHTITLTVTAPDGRKSSTTLQVLVTACEC